MAEDILRLSSFDSKAIVPLSSRVDGVYVQKLAIAGNDLLSSVFVESLDSGASVLVEYFDYGVGSDAGENFPLQAHDAVSTAVTTNRKRIVNIHDKPYVRCTVTGGTVRFGVYVTVKDPIGSSSSGSGGGTEEPTGDPLFVDQTAVSTPGSEQTLLSYTVPASKILYLYSVRAVCRQESSFQILADGDQIGSGRTGAMSPNVHFDFGIHRPYAAATVIEVKATVRTGAIVSTIDCYLQGRLVDV